MVFDAADFRNHEQVVFAADPASGLRAIIAVHDTTLGPSLGGCRITTYPSEADAVVDALRLAAGMTAKAALAGLPLGGGKSVIMLDPDRPKTPAMMRAMGVAIERLGGRYIAAEDIGATPADMDAISEATTHVTGLSTGVGDPAPWTAEGVFRCLERAALRRFDRTDLAGLHVVVKGLGAVGGRLAEKLAGAGARLTLADINADRARNLAAKFGGATVDPDGAAAVPADVYAPCALGAEFSAETIPTLGAPLICGAANNQLATPEDGARLRAAGVLYCPDYLVNAGGLISVARPPLGMDETSARARLAQLPDTLAAVLDRAEAEAAPTAEVADRIVADRLAAARTTSPEA